MKLKSEATILPALRKLDVTLAVKAEDGPKQSFGLGQVVLAVDSSNLAVGYVLYQIFEDGRHPIMFGSITWNEVEARYSQAKLELYGYFRAMKAMRHFLWGLPIIVELDASYIKSMINSADPGLPNAAMTRWISYIYLFTVKRYVHVEAEKHKGPDGLSRRTRTGEDSSDTDDNLEPDEGGHFISAKREVAKRLKAPNNQGWLKDDQPSGQENKDHVLVYQVTDDKEDYQQQEPNDDIIWNRPSHVSMDFMLPLILSEREQQFIEGTRLKARPYEPPDVTNNRKREDSIIFHARNAKTPNLSADAVTTNQSQWEFKELRILALQQTRVAPQGKIQAKSNREIETQSESQTDEVEEEELSKTGKTHKHQTLSENNGRYWEEIKAYLGTLRVPSGVRNRKTFLQTTRKYFLYQDELWRRAPNQPRKVITDITRRQELIRSAHRESGHRGREPTYKKLADSYFWPNMTNQIKEECQTCYECQRRSAYVPKVRIQPTWVPTIFRKVNIDIVDMGIRTNDGYKFIVDARDDFSGWLEAKALKRKTAANVAKFLWTDLICRYGCIIQITTDNGTEFKDAVEILLKKYRIKLVHSAPRHPEGNEMIERGHRTWIESIWKLCGREKGQWVRYVNDAIMADRVTVRRTTGFSPYQLLYGTANVFPYEINDGTWYTLDWSGVKTTRDLLAIRMKQFRGVSLNRKQALQNTIRTRRRAADDYAKLHQKRLVSGIYQPGEMILISQKERDLDQTYQGMKAMDRWAGPFRIVRKYESGSYKVAELDGAELSGAIPASHIKAFKTKETLGDLTDETTSSSESALGFEESSDTDQN